MNKVIKQPKKRGAPFGNKNASKQGGRKRLLFGTTVAQETLEYIESLKNEIGPGYLIDAAVKLYRTVKEQDSQI